MKYSTRHTAAVLGLSVMSLSVSLAWAAAPDAGQLLNEQRRLNQPAQRGDLDGRPAVNTPLADDGQAGLRARIDRIRFTGAEDLLPEPELQALVADAKGRQLSHSQLQSLAARVTAALQKRGFLLARAYLPRQDLTQGELEIVVLSGRLQSGRHRVTVSGADERLAPRLGAIADTALAQGPVRYEQLERALLLINDVPGVQARATLERGDEPGTSRLDVRTDTGRAWALDASADDFNNRYTGQWRVGAAASLIRPLNREDLLQASVSRTDGSRQAALAYGFGVHPSGLRAQFATTWMDYRVGEDLKPLDLRGTARTVSAGLSYPLLRGRERNLWISTEAEQRTLVDEALGQTLRDRRLNRLTVNLYGNLWDATLGGAQNDFGLGVTNGTVTLREAADRVADSVTARTAGSYDKLTWRVSRLQTANALPGWGLYVGGYGQLSARNLDSSEKFLLGGPSGVRAYPVGEASGDNGWVGTAELRRELSVGSGIAAQLIGFVDYGRVEQHERLWATALGGQPNSYALGGAGVGANLAGERWTLRASWARAIGHNAGRSAAGRDADGRADRQRFWLQAAFHY
ncbi:MAG: ShlB/FhaC/HecB family hemolysin secretion/activation protein [Mitsuaria chitosanitabida]|uniref:ShlB/FhaC/HecB family hemolysin secretion/activation protein n=1 Tax=Roseateles chitosanitabidus TaxID=65048 RepID=UPI001B187D25|nr:ShlB/FhaC/HecB family hemolysin secretion/activation protein [Roseateles chitosanitabidus]MBO9688006.1 ShlB/FhaC/HecB family hemolysin secretion/activation protein [Roseateles chitosanitabidus]